MNAKKFISLSASWLIFGVAALSGSAVAAETASTQSDASKPAMHDMSAHGHGQAGGMKCNHQDSMMKAHAGGMMCDHEGGMGCSHKAGAEGEQGAGMMCNHEGGMGCSHKAGAEGEQGAGMMCNHEGGMGCCHKAGMGGEQGAEMKCNHEGGMKCGHGDGMACGHQAGMKGGPMAGRMGGYGAGMMGHSRMPLIMSLDLTADQRARIEKLSDELMRSNKATEGSIRQESAKLRDLYAADKRNPSAIGKTYQKIFDMQRKMIEKTITAQNRIEEVLTAEQRTRLKSMRQEAGQGKATGAHNHQH